MTGEFLLEIGIEEIPASYVNPALNSLSELLKNFLESSFITFGSVDTFATPRRLGITICDVAQMQSSREIVKTGPPVSQAFDSNGAPTKAAIGFAKSQGVEVSDLSVVDGPKGNQIAVKRVEEGRPTSQALAEALPGIFERISFPKTMRWMGMDERFVRPIHWILAILNGSVVSFTFAGIQSGNRSFGHRFISPEFFSVKDFNSLKAELTAQGIELDPEKRKSMIEEKINNIALDNGLKVLNDQDLLDEVTFLVESPYPIMGQFAEEFLELPASILITCMKKHQRYFSVQDQNGRITNRFIAVNNTPVKDVSVSIRGHQRVLKARLEDARFYFKEDRKTPLVSRLDALKGVVFHSRLGTAYEKVERFNAIARLLAEQLVPELVTKIQRATLLCKCDLETGIVYEFPELQGIIGSYYARMDGEDEDIAISIREHYLPSRAGDTLPEGPIGSVVSIADRMDTICGCFGVGLIPSGAADPYALRRHALAIIQILIDKNWHLNLPQIIQYSLKLLKDKLVEPIENIETQVLDFFKARFVNFHSSRDFSLDVVEAAVRAGFIDIVDVRARVEALNIWKQRKDFDAIMVGFKRVVNILKDVDCGPVDPSKFVEEAEKLLFEAYSGIKEECDEAIYSGDYQKALEMIADLRTPIDNFFDGVMVMVENSELRTNRQALLGQVSSLFKNIADFSFIGSTAS
ncbi:MAG: glycine--tRNA ligase subunit beta [Syntrophaceae bacterium]|nr:glycine--tRNA ligase subunit beta [Syntrophaceae bacterium]